MAGGDQVLDQIRRVAAFMTKAPEEPTRSVDDVRIDPEMRKPASNTVGAYLRVAYWLAVGIRVQVHRRNEALRQGEIAAAIPSQRLAEVSTVAVGALGAAAAAAGISASRWVGTGWVADLLLRGAGLEAALRSSDPDDIAAVYDIGIRAAADAKLHRVQRALQALAAAEPRDDRQLPEIIPEAADEVPVGVWIAVGAIALIGLAWIAGPTIAAVVGAATAATAAGRSR